MSKGAQIAVGALLIAGLLGWYGWTTLQGGRYRYYKTLDELAAAGPAVLGSVRVHGYVAVGSIERDVASRRVRFVVQNTPPHLDAAPAAAGPASPPASRETLDVVYDSLETPDLFKDGAEVVVEGTLETEGTGRVLRADNVLAKCPSKFQAKLAEGEPASAPPGNEPARL